MSNKVRRIVIVKWRDACELNGSRSYKECLEEEMPIYETFGIFLGKDETTLRLACESRIDESCLNREQFRLVNLIPIGSIISIKTLKR